MGKQTMGAGQVKGAKEMIWGIDQRITEAMAAMCRASCTPNDFDHYSESILYLTKARASMLDQSYTEEHNGA